MRLPTGPDITPTNIFNPTLRDFTCTYVEKNKPIEYTIKSLETATFPKYLADHIVKHLAQKIALDKLDSGTAYEILYQEAVQSILK